MTCASAPSSSSTDTSTSICGSPGSANAASSKLSGRIPRMTVPSRLGGVQAQARGGSPRTRRFRPATVCLDEIHRRGADEGGDEQVRRLVVQVLRGVHLLDPSVPHHRHPLAERQRLDLVVRHVDRRSRRAARAGARAPRASPPGASRRGSTAARPSGRPRAHARSPAPSPRAGADLRRARRADGRADPRARAASPPRRLAARSRPSASCAP